MICPFCQKEPLPLNGYIWKPQAVTLTCSHCGKKLRMAPETLKSAMAMVVGLGLSIVLLGFIAAYFAVRNHLFSELTPGMAALAIVVLLGLCVGGAIIVRRVLWQRPYIADPSAG
jgi:hypothetical protein